MWHFLLPQTGDEDVFSGLWLLQTVERPSLGRFWERKTAERTRFTSLLLPKSAERGLLAWWRGIFLPGAWKIMPVLGGCARSVGRGVPAAPRRGARGPRQARQLPSRGGGLSLMPFGNSVRRLSRRDIVRIAQRFNAGLKAGREASPGGTTEKLGFGLGFCRPSGTLGLRPRQPSVETLGSRCPSGTTFGLNSRKALGLTGLQRRSPALTSLRWG